jgi:hypothetical protein
MIVQIQESNLHSMKSMANFSGNGGLSSNSRQLLLCVLNLRCCDEETTSCAGDTCPRKESLETRAVPIN